jgi:hypothetical protein
LMLITGNVLKLRAQHSLDSFFFTNKALKNNVNQVIRSNGAPNLPPISLFPLSLETKGQQRASEEAKKTTCSFQAYGFGLGSVSAPN